MELKRNREPLVVFATINGIKKKHYVYVRRILFFLRYFTVLFRWLIDTNEAGQ